MRIVYDAKLKKPGCVLLQAIMGGTVPDFQQRFPGNWIVNMTPDLRLYEVTEDQLDLLSELSKKERR